MKWVSQAWLEVLEFLEPKANKDSWVLLGLKDNRAYLALLGTLWRGPKETEDLRVNLVCQVRACQHTQVISSEPHFGLCSTGLCAFLSGELLESCRRDDYRERCSRDAIWVFALIRVML